MPDLRPSSNTVIRFELNPDNKAEHAVLSMLLHWSRYRAFTSFEALAQATGLKVDEIERATRRLIKRGDVWEVAGDRR